MEDQIRKIVREEIARALSAAGEVAANADTYDTDHIESVALGSITRTMERVARDVLANSHPVREHEHTASTEPVHTITAVPERPKATCTCHRHTHVMAQSDWCGHPGCLCRTPVRARAEHTASTECRTCGHTSHAAGECAWWGENPCFCTEHTASTDVPRTCPVCSHGEHDQGKCGMHVYVDGVALPCPCPFAGGRR